MKIINNLNYIKFNLLKSSNKEEYYMFLIKISKFLPKISKVYYNKKFKIIECQNNVWLFLKIILINNNKYINIYAYSDTLIIKGILYIIFLYYHNISINNSNIIQFLKNINLFKYLSFIRINGIINIIKSIKNKILFN